MNLLRTIFTDGRYYDIESTLIAYLRGRCLAGPEEAQGWPAFSHTFTTAYEETVRSLPLQIDWSINHMTYADLCAAAVRTGWIDRTDSYEEEYRTAYRHVVPSPLPRLDAAGPLVLGLALEAWVSLLDPAMRQTIVAMTGDEAHEHLSCPVNGPVAQYLRRFHHERDALSPDDRGKEEENRVLASVAL